MSTTTYSLKTIFTPSASCLSSVFHRGWWQLGPLSTSDCLPPNYQIASGFYYSPGVCPSGYIVACSRTVVAATLTETIATCCPSDYSCHTNSDLTFFSTLGCYTNGHGTLPFISGSSTLSKNPEGPGGVNAYSVQVRWQSSDLLATSVYTTTVTSNPTTVTSTPTTATTPGLNTSGKVGIGLGVPIALFVISIALWMCYPFGKDRERGRPHKGNAASAYFQNNTELPVQELA